MAATLQFWGGLVLAALVANPASPVDRTPELRARFEHETNPAHKAKLMQKLGAAEFKDIEKDVANSQFASAADLLHQYRNEVELCSKELDATGVNAEKKPDGFKQLQISVRESLERVDRLISTMTADQQVPLRADRNRLEELNSHLLQELFPRAPNRRLRDRYHIPIP
ncbi:MAG TPA: hypothetical protein VNK23_00090 [Candidatus Dormibacteraeota bacterium]|nr:hypothetical protein [Candidatus Dormibacteraeota bacterium]